MRLLDRYLLREFVVPLAYCLGAFLIFWISFMLISEMDEFQRAQLTALDIAEYFVVTLPELLTRVVPFGLLLAMLYALNNHARHQELTAMRVAGLSLWRISLPYLGVAAGCGALLFTLNEYWMPDSAERTEQLMQRRLAGNLDPAQRDWRRNLSFKNDRTQRTWHIYEYNLVTHEMRQPFVEWVGTNQTKFSLFAERADYEGGQWIFTNVQMVVWVTNQFVPGRGFTNQLVVPEFNETPELIRSELKISSLSNFKQARGAQLTLREIREYQHWHHDQNDKEAMLNTKFHVRLALPFTCPVIVLIALPFGAAHGRRNVFVGVASSIFIAFAFYVLQRFGEAAGMGGHLAPWLAGWLPNLLFAGAGAWLTHRNQ